MDQQPHFSKLSWDKDLDPPFLDQYLKFWVGRAWLLGVLPKISKVPIKHIGNIGLVGSRVSGLEE